jgi:uncharacterized protein (DUF1015 family)
MDTDFKLKQVNELINEHFLKLGIKIPEVLLPQKGVDLFKWAVVACDQYTSEPDYWEEVARVVGDAPSTLNLIFPEVYLGKGAEGERIARIHREMGGYLEQKLIGSPGAGFVYLERQTSHAKCRKGLIMAIDLECYDYNPGSKTLVRATEGTVLERIPPRVKIREGAPLELPHIMVLIDDPDCQVIEPLTLQKEKFEQLYDTDLMMNGGHVQGYLVRDERILEEIYRGFVNLVEPAAFNRKYQTTNEPVLLFAVGDGNHSLATAKAVWEKIKQHSQVDLAKHPARYALVEVVNIHDPGLQFEPIHRVLFNVASEELFEAMRVSFGEGRFNLERSAAWQEIEAQLGESSNRTENRHRIGFVDQEGYGIITIANPKSDLEVGTLQSFMDEWLAQHSETKIDYIHGADVVRKLGSEKGNIGFFLPTLPKSALFKTVVHDGVLPRKSFSMGEAEEKRFYLECRRIG